MSEFKNTYPCVMIHGFGGYGSHDLQDKQAHYWGIGPLYLKPHFESMGIEFYNPSLGPFNSTWDRTCVLWAYLFGGTVDFGKVHSEKHHHARYGDTFEHGVLEDLGKTEAHKKINLFGHSFGGPTVIEIAQLFSFGSEEERQGTDPDDLSPLFAGGHGDLIHTVTTLSGVNNGTTMASALGVKGMTIATWVVLMVATMVGETRWQKFWNFHVQQFGIGKYPDEITKENAHFCSPLKNVPAIRNYANNFDRDNSGREMQIEVLQKLNTELQMDPGIYYFAQRANGARKKKNGKYRPRFPLDPLCFLSGWLTGSYSNPEIEKYGVGKDPLWGQNDGFVNVRGQSGPINMPTEDADYGTDFKPGIWYNMPVEPGDHMLWIGLWRTPKRLFGIYDRMLNIYRNLPDGGNV